MHTFVAISNNYPCISHYVPCSQSLNIWLGGLFTPEAYITATRQYVAQANNWSLEELYLDVSVVVVHKPLVVVANNVCIL